MTRQGFIVASLTIGCSMAWAADPPGRMLRTPDVTGPAASGVEEGEMLVPAARASEGGVSVQKMGGFGAGWSGGAQLFWSPTRVGSRLDLNLPVARAGRYALAGWFTQAPDYGRFDVDFAGRRTGGFDGYHGGGVVRGERVALGEVDAPAQGLALVLTITGKAQASRGYLVGIDALELTPVAARIQPGPPAAVARPVEARRQASLAALGGVVVPTRRLGFSSPAPTLTVWNGISGAEFSFYGSEAFIDWNRPDVNWKFQWTRAGGAGVKAVWQVCWFHSPLTRGDWRKPAGLVASGEVADVPAPGHVGNFQIDFAEFSPRPPVKGLTRGNPKLEPAGAEKPLTLQRAEPERAERIVPGGPEGKAPVGAKSPASLTVKAIDSKTLSLMTDWLGGNPRTYHVRLVVLDAKGEAGGQPSEAVVVHYGQPAPQDPLKLSNTPPPPPKPDPLAPKVTIAEYAPIRPQASDATEWYLVTQDFMTFKKGKEYHFVPTDKSFWDKVEGAFGDAVGFFEGAINWVSTAYSDIKSTAVNTVASAIPGCGGTCKDVLSYGLDTGLTAVGLPPDLPNFDQLVDMGKGNLADTLVAQAGLENVPLSDELAKQLVDKLADQAKQTADHGPGGGQWLRPAPSKQYRPAFVRITVTNPPNAPARDMAVSFYAWYLFLGHYVPVPNVKPGETRTITLFLKPDLQYWQDKYIYDHKGYAGSSGDMEQGWTDLYYQGQADLYAEAIAWPTGQVNLFKGKPAKSGSRGADALKQRPCEPYVAK